MDKNEVGKLASKESYVIKFLNMKNPSSKSVLVAFLRGINVGGHHKVPMAELKATLASMGFSDIKTLLNSGNVVFTTVPTEIAALEAQMAEALEKQFGFPVPVLIRKMEDIQQLVADNPFKNIEVHKDIRLYVTFLRNDAKNKLTLPWTSADGAFHILSSDDKMLLSTVDISKTKTTDAMKVLDKNFTKDVTTRNWNTLVKIAQLAP
jgi:uncharacterized protein (DUF1697 family)